MGISLEDLRASMIDRKATNVGPSHIDVTYQRLGSSAAPPVLLIMGGGAQLIHWPDAFCSALVEHNLQVIRFDNRDSGRSTHFSSLGLPDFPALMAGDLSTAPYTLSDMAADTVGLLDFLAISAAHIVGASLGGQIAQTLAIEHPQRVLSLTSIMSTTGNLSVGFVAPEVMKEIFSGPFATTRDDVVAQRVRAMQVVGSPGFPTPLERIAERAALAYDRSLAPDGSYDPYAIARHGAACLASGDRTTHLRNLRVPTLVIHGTADRMVDPSGGRATAEAIPGAELVMIEGMGHDLAPGLVQQLADRIANFIEKAARPSTSCP